jgi:hypothetical protein
LARVEERIIPQARFVVSYGMPPNWIERRCFSGCRYAGSA